MPASDWSTGIPSPNVYDVPRDWIRVRSRDFFGRCVRSPHGAHAVVWRNARYERETGKLRSMGFFVMIEDQRVRVSGDVHRVMMAAVSDAGTFVIACGPRRPGDLQSTVYVVGANGTIVIEQWIDALVDTGAISFDGRYVVVQAACGNGDQGHCHAWDIDRRVLLWRRRLLGPWPTRLAVDPDLERLHAQVGLDVEGPTATFDLMTGGAPGGRSETDVPAVVAASHPA